MSDNPIYSFQLPRGLLRAMALFQADTDRSALCCTNFEIRKAGVHHELTIVAIDGRRMVTYRTEILKDTLFGEIPDTDDIIVDLSGCANLPKVAPVDSVTCEVFPKHIDFVADKIRYTGQRTDAADGGFKFPSWRSIIPSSQIKKVDQIAVNHELLADFGKASKLITERGSNLSLQTFGDGLPISVQIMGHREFYGIIMPLRAEHPEAFPDWLLSEAENKKEGGES